MVLGTALEQKKKLLTSDPVQSEPYWDWRQDALNQLSCRCGTLRCARTSAQSEQSEDAQKYNIQITLNARG